ncbi:rod-binding protein [Methylobacterium gossipiicola]|uniref:Rod binding protein n=1 Tax=Methylobacterium gossipiicola TaxID=582675 RepID=A0A1I2UGW9_9HYPH|nr:rod-binding protein [Methylobacterium gossipiicola]SFG76263.1 Rod binding protein [Methylobacterium gossipiicola]
MLLAPLAMNAAMGVGKAILGDIAQSVSGVSRTAEEAAKAASKTAAGAVRGATAGTPRTDAEIRARKASTEFETMFLEQTLDRLTQSEGTDGPLGDNGTGGGIYRSMLAKEYAGQIVKSGGVGISDQVYREMMKMQEGSHVGVN